MTIDAFTHRGYQDLLNAFSDRGYRVRSYATAEPRRKDLILRHDLDMSLQAAEPIADIEADLGLAAHYFVLLRTEMYNPFSAASRRALDHIRSCGHEIGLHLDASLYGNDPAALEQAAEWECRALEGATGAPVHFISFHRPAESLLGHEAPLAGRRHAYQPRFFQEMGYCSDSRGAWHHGHPLENAAVKEGHALQLLTHPIWWPAEPMDGPVVKLEVFTEERRQLLRRELAKNCEPFRAALEQDKRT